MTSENVVFKQLGPVLVKQDQAEAKSNIETRLRFIQGEMLVHINLFQNDYLTNYSKRVETQIKDIEVKQEKKKAEVYLYFRSINRFNILSPPAY